MNTSQNLPHCSDANHRSYLTSSHDRHVVSTNDRELKEHKMPRFLTVDDPKGFTETYSLPQEVLDVFLDRHATEITIPVHVGGSKKNSEQSAAG
jgi:hypothetical protein